MELHVALIVLHASFATIAFGIGCSLLATLPRSARTVRFIAYFVSALLAVGLLLAVVLVDWVELPTVKRIAFGALGVLALYMAALTVQAWLSLRAESAGWRGRFAGHVGLRADLSL